MKQSKIDFLKVKNFLGDKKSKKIILLIVVALLFIIVLYDFFPFFQSSEEEKEEIVSEKSYVEELEEKLKNILLQTKGVGSCEIVITAVGGTEYVYATETSDKNQTTVSGDRTQTDTDSKVSVKTVTDQKNEKPLVEKEIYPEIQGVVIICDGGGNSGTKAVATEIASTLLGVTKDKIVVEERR